MAKDNNKINKEEGNTNGIRVLVAEDDKFLIRVLSDKLRRRGFEVIIASDGIEAVNKIKSGKPDLVLLDLVMPNKDGFEILEEIKTDKKYKKIPIIILSNLGQKSDIEKGKKLGADDYLVKSNLSINAVVDKVKEVLAFKKISR